MRGGFLERCLQVSDYFISLWHIALWAFSLIFGILALFLNAIEPNNAVWLAGVSGGFFSVALGKDKHLNILALHTLIGAGIGVAGSQIQYQLIHLPQPAAAFVLGIAGVSLALRIMRYAEQGDLTALLPKWFKGGQ